MVNSMKLSYKCILDTSREKISIAIKDIHLVIYSSVYPPLEDSWQTLYAALDHTPHGNIILLDIGCGTGLIGVYTSMNKALQYLVQSDLSSCALSNAKENIKVNRLDYLADLVQADRVSFLRNKSRRNTVLVYNAPYLNCTPSDEYDLQYCGGCTHITEFINKIINLDYIRLVVVTFSTESGCSIVELLKPLIHKLKKLEIYLHHKFFETIITLAISLRT